MTYVSLAVAFFLAGVVPELTGFGVATVTMPILSLVMPLSLVLPLVAIISMAATGFVALQNEEGGYSRIAALVFGSLFGVVLGMIFLHLIDEALLSSLFGGFLVVYALYSVFADEISFEHNKLVGSFVGLLAGFFGAAFNIHGPLVGLYSISKEEDASKSEIKGLTATYMFISGIFTVVGHYLSGRITTDVIYYMLFSLPFLAIGLAVGTKFSHHLSSQWVKYGIYVFVFAAGIILLL